MSEKNASEIRKAILTILTDGKLEENEKRTKIAIEVVTALSKCGRFFYNAEMRDFSSALFFHGQSNRLERIRSDVFAGWLSDWLGINRADPVFRYILAEVETTALCSQVSQPVIPEIFWAARPEAYYISSGDSIVRITAKSLDLVPNGTDGVLFTAGQTLAPWNLTNPVDPFEASSLFRTLQSGAPHGQDLLRLYIYSLPTNPRTKPTFCAVGPIGSGKTRVARGIGDLYGFPFVPAKVEEKGENDFWVALDQGGFLVLDNVDTKTRWLADALANASTDGGTKRRKLYTNQEQIVLRARAWCFLTTANPTFAEDPGLADRLLVLRLRRREGDTSDKTLTEEILNNRDGMLSHIALTLQKAIADSFEAPGNLNARHPDFAATAVRIGRALGREHETILALEAAEADKSVFCLENEPLAVVLINWMKEVKEFSGTSAQLSEKLNFLDPELKLTPKSVGKRISGLWPHLEQVLSVAKRETDRKGFTIYTLQIR